MKENISSGILRALRNLVVIKYCFTKIGYVSPQQDRFLGLTTYLGPELKKRGKDRELKHA